MAANLQPLVNSVVTGVGQGGDENQYSPLSTIAIPANANGGYITNPLTAADQNIFVAEPLYINPIGDATIGAGGDVFALQPGQTWTIIPGQTTPTSVISKTPFHQFSGTYWL